MKALRYLLSLIAILSVVSVSAATFGKPYQPQRRGIQYTRHYAEMPTLSMSTMNASMMKSGSALPMAAVTGTTSADDYAPSSGPRRAKKEVNPFTGEGTAGDIGNPLEPAVPLGDAILPLLLLACAYIGWRARKRAVKVNG